MAKDIISIEKVLNSRCSSDLETVSEKLHWGTMTDQLPPQSVIDQVFECCKVPRFSNGDLIQWWKDGYLYTGFKLVEGSDMARLLNIESGMQQQAVYLACSAMGLGTCILNQGVNGTVYGEKIATGRHMLRVLSSNFEFRKFSEKAPGPQKPFVAGININVPLRDGNVECLPELPRLTTSNKMGRKVTEPDVSQLLWAAKGRTPHLIRLHKWKTMWGLTIPTWTGGQDYTSVYLVVADKLYRYVNWTKDFTLLGKLLGEKLKWTRGNPTHDIKLLRKINISDQINGFEKAIILSQNEKTCRALWEVGYMLENLFLQAKSLAISYDSKIFTSQETLQLAHKGVPGSVAALLI
ncbi:MAG: hypothetical protein NWE95_07160 [Candidatus Bathyarchaeota archaeon]|nr:hypothetical protein [Candidatus Bathyarchaeota archaeon]